MPTTNPVEKYVNSANRKIATAARLYYDLYTKRLDAGDTPEAAASYALGKSGFVDATSGATAASIAAAFEAGKADVGIAFVREVWLNKTYKGSTISARILKNARLGSAQVSTVTRNAMRDGKAWTAIAKDISDADLLSGDVSKKISRLADIGRRSLTEKVDQREYLKALDDAEAHIARLAQDGAPTMRLKAAYQDVVNAVEKGSEKAIKGAIKRAVDAKVNYNAQRIARTETARAWGVSRSNDFLQDDAVVGYKWRLSTRHPKFDICDIHANADLYGMGAGVYPKDKGPEYPAHCNCTCGLSPVYRTDIDNPSFDPASGDKYLDGLSEFKRQQILGVAGEQAWQDGADWQDVAKGYTGQTTKKVVPLKK